MTTMLINRQRLAEAVGRLIDQFKGQPTIEAFIEAWSQQAQELENAGFEVIEDTLIGTAIGAQLDGLGSIVGVERQGLADEDFRTVIRTRILLNQPECTIDYLLTLANAISGGSEASLEELYPASFILRILDPLPSGIDGPRIGGLIRAGRAAGVGSSTVIHVDPPFTLDGAAGTGFDAGRYAGVY